MTKMYMVYMCTFYMYSAPSWSGAKRPQPVSLNRGAPHGQHAAQKMTKNDKFQNCTKLTSETISEQLVIDIYLSEA